MSLWGRVFAAGYDRFMAGTEKAGLHDKRRALLAQAKGRVIEIGAGTGANLDVYGPGVTELVLTEPEEPMARRLRTKAASSARVVEAPADALPFPDDSFDTAVCTLVLCTVPDQGAALREIARVLVPGGQLLFLEHVRSHEPKSAKWQDRLTPLQKRFGHGCHPNRDTAAQIAAAGFTVDELEEGELPKAPAFVRPMIHGVAVAPERRAAAAVA